MRRAQLEMCGGSFDLVVRDATVMAIWLARALVVSLLGVARIRRRWQMNDLAPSIYV